MLEISLDVVTLVILVPRYLYNIADTQKISTEIHNLELVMDSIAKQKHARNELI